MESLNVFFLSVVIYGLTYNNICTQKKKNSKAIIKRTFIIPPGLCNQASTLTLNRAALTIHEWHPVYIVCNLTNHQHTYPAVSRPYEIPSSLQERLIGLSYHIIYMRVCNVYLYCAICAGGLSI